MGLVATWLRGIGLEEKIPSFTAAGIVTPAALAELDVTHFEALGVTDAEDRRKLFYLVQRIKMAVARKDESVVNAVDAVLAQTMGSSADLDESKALEEDSQMSPPRRTRSTRRKEKQNLNESSPPRAPARAVAGSLPMRLHEELPLSDRAPGADFLSEGDGESVDAVGSTNDWGLGSSGGDSADDEASSVTDTDRTRGGRRQSRRLQEKRVPTSLDKRHSTDSFASSKSGRRSGLVHPTANRRSTSSSRRRKSDSAVHRPAEEQDSSTSDNSSSKPPARCSSGGVPVPKGRRAESSRVQKNPSKSMRTGKQLSTIPANSIAPMSPLVDLPPSKLAAAVEEPKGRKTRHSRRRSSSFDRLSTSQSESDSRTSCGGGNSSDSETNRRRISKSGSDTQRRKSGYLGSESSMNMEPSRRQSLGSFRHGTNQSRDDSDPNGRNDGDSWKSQIARLREDNESDHQLFSSPRKADTEDEEDMRIRVIVRKRPMSRDEIAAAGDVDVIHPLAYSSYGRVLVYQPRTRVDLTKEIETVPFAFDNVFDEKSTNVQIYERAVRNLIPSLFEGQWASIFAYGQTGSGKTFTMMGSNMTGLKNGSNTLDTSNLGLYYMAALDIFQAIQTEGLGEFTVGVSLFEIYGGKLFDLLNSRKQVKCLEDGKGKIRYPGLSEHNVANPDELIDLIEQGASNRSTGTTSRNADSSRSHAVLQLHLQTSSSKRDNVEHSRLTFIDLAGSERGADTSSANRATRLEGAEINTSLLALKEVIRALATGDSLTHVPFRGSKLTQVLKESFVGQNCRSVMIACISPNIGNCEQTLNTLRYADRVKERNAETGEFAMSVASVAGRTSMAKSGQSLSALADTSEPEAPATPVGEMPSHSNHSFGSATDVLDELLSSPVKAADNSVEETDAEIDQPSDSSHILEQLVSAHKAAMSRMLNMVKEEMTLVNQADADREGLEDYITQLVEIQDEQLSLIATMRENLLRYRISRANEGTHANCDLVSLDESFEDLRD